MKRNLALVTALALLLLSVFASTVLAHEVTMVGAITVRSDQVAIRLMDALTSPIPGAQVSVATGLPDQKPGKPAALAEGPKGTYKGVLSQPASGEIYVITISVTTPTGDVHEASVRANRGQDLPELMTSLAPAAARGPNWGLYIYIAAGIVLATATVVALLRRRGSEDGEG